MTGPLGTHVAKRLPWLFDDLRFRVAYEEYYPKSFGDALLALQSDSLRLRFVRDRTRLEVELASISEPDLWLNLRFLWFTLTGDLPDPELEGWAWFFREHAAELTEALGPKFPQTKEEFERKQRERIADSQNSHPPLTLHGRISRFGATPLGMISLGPLGWMVAAALIVWEVMK
jgi:hypothetical protein